MRSSVQFALPTTAPFLSQTIPTRHPPCQASPPASSKRLYATATKKATGSSILPGTSTESFVTEYTKAACLKQTLYPNVVSGMKRALSDRDGILPADPSKAQTAEATQSQSMETAKHAKGDARDSFNTTAEAQIMEDHEPEEVEVALRVKWCGSTYAVELTTQSTVLDLKQRLFELTEVHPKRQKVLGLPFISGKPPADTFVLDELSLKPDQRLMLVGSREADISALNAAYEADDDIINDLDVDYDGEENHEYLRRAYNKRLERRIETTEFRIINPPRPGKKLLVLDLDYTLFDCRGHGESIADLGRPGLHPFLASAYRKYDIVVWSQTSWRWLEAKLTGLSMLFSTDYKLSFVLDRTSMFSITTRKGKQKRTHEVKALEIIWRSHKQWDPTNTIHIDDLSKNFALNPQSGLKITAFKNAHVTRQYDRELFALSSYLSLIAQREPDFTKLKHKHWKRYCSKYARQGDGDDSNGDPPRQ